MNTRKENYKNKHLDGNTENAYLKPRYEYIGTGKADTKDKCKKAGQHQIEIKKPIEDIKSRAEAETTKEIAYSQIQEALQKLHLKIEQIEHEIAHLESDLAQVYDISKKQPGATFFIVLIILFAIYIYLLGQSK